MPFYLIFGGASLSRVFRRCWFQSGKWNIWAQCLQQILITNLLLKHYVNDKRQYYRILHFSVHYFYPLNAEKERHFANAFCGTGRWRQTTRSSRSRLNSRFSYYAFGQKPHTSFCHLLLFLVLFRLSHGTVCLHNIKPALLKIHFSERAIKNTRPKIPFTLGLCRI